MVMCFKLCFELEQMWNFDAINVLIIEFLGMCSAVRYVSESENRWFIQFYENHLLKII